MGWNVPVLGDWDDSRMVVEMSFVQPPYFLDFGKVWIDQPPADFYDSQKLANAQAIWRDLFGERWPDVSLALWILRTKYGIHYVDPRPGNIDFGDEDDGDWEREPEIDMGEYD